MSKSLIGAVAALGFAMTLGSVLPAAADAYGNWKRPNGDTAAVSNCGGKLCGKITAGKKPGFVMFNGIASSGANAWKGDMKHPDMPGFMTFNGTVTLKGDKLVVKGCAVGQSMCDAETWTR